MPVPDRDGLLFLTVLGVGGVAIVVDLLTVVPAPAGPGRPADAGDLLGAGRGATSTASRVLPFIVGAAGFLWLLVADNVDRVRRFGRRFTGDGRDVDVWEPSPLAAAGRRLASIGVAVAVLLPLAVPGLTTGLLVPARPRSATASAPAAGAGGNGRVNLFASLSGQLTQTDTERPGRGDDQRPDPFYLRFGVADQVTTDGLRQPLAARAAR